MPGGCCLVGLAPGVHEGAAHLFQDERAPVQSDDPLVVQVDQQPSGRGAEQSVGIRDNRDDHCVSAREDLAVEVCAELSERAAAAGLLAAVPGEHGGPQDASLVAHLLMQRDVAGFDARHDVRP
jgi:hypothetical protein